MVKDRNAFTDNKITRGVPADEAKTVKAFGVPKEGYGDLIPAGPRMKGSSMEELGYLPKNYPQPEFVPAKKSCKGNEGTCKAHPAKGTDYCIGHLRSIEQTKH